MSVKRYRYRLYPDKEQAGQLARVFGCARVTYNDVIAARRAAHASGEKTPSVNDLMKLMARSKQTEERAWLGEVTDVALQQSMRDADTAYKNFFASLKKAKTGNRSKGKRVGVPRFKSRKDHQDSFRITGRQNFAVRKVAQHRAKVRLPKIGWVHLTLSRELPVAPSSVTVIREADGRYYVSFVVDAPARVAPEPVHQVVGQPGRGLSHLAVLAHDDGSTEKIENPRHLKKKVRKLATAQKELARRQKGSANRTKSRLKVAALHRKVRETRLDHHHKLARRVVVENQVIGLETLSITGLGRTRMAKSVNDAGWGILVRLIEEKAMEAGRTLVRADRFFPSTRRCHACGVAGERKALHVRSWTCVCGVSHDRDINAALNLRDVAAGQAETLNDRGGHVSPACVPATA